MSASLLGLHFNCIYFHKEAVWYRFFVSVWFCLQQDKTRKSFQMFPSQSRAYQKPAVADSQPCFCSLWGRNILLRRWLPFALQSNDSWDFKLAHVILILAVEFGSLLIALIKVSPYSTSEGHPSFRQQLRWTLEDSSGTQLLEGCRCHTLPRAARIYNGFG